MLSEPHRFEPFFSDKSEEKGIGLAVVQGVMERLQGYLLLESRPDAGALFRLLLPIAMGERQPAVDDSQLVVDDGVTLQRRVLLVDDDVAVALRLQEAPAFAGLAVDPFNSGIDALAAFEADPKSYDHGDRSGHADNDRCMNCCVRYGNGMPICPSC